MIPVLAEIYGVTCDDILRGQRLSPEREDGAASRAKALKQAQYLCARTLSQFKSGAAIAVAVSVAGMALHLAVCYSFFRPLLGAGLGLIFLLASTVLQAVQLNRGKSALAGSMSQEEGLCPEEFLDAPRRMNRISFCVWGLNAWALLLIWPMAAHGFYDGFSVRSFDWYTAAMPGQTLLFLILFAGLAWALRGWLGQVQDGKSVFQPLYYSTKNLRRLALAQGAFLILLVLALAFLQFVIMGMKVGASLIAEIAAVVPLLAVIVAYIVLSIRTCVKIGKGLERKLCRWLGIRGMLYGLAILFWANGPSTILALPLQPALITIGYLGIKYWLVKKHGAPAE